MNPNTPEYSARIHFKTLTNCQYPGRNQMFHIDVKQVDKTGPPERKNSNDQITSPGNKALKPRMGIYIPNLARSWRIYNPAVWVFRHRSQEQRNLDKEIGIEVQKQ